MQVSHLSCGSRETWVAPLKRNTLTDPGEYGIVKGTIELDEKATLAVRRGTLSRDMTGRRVGDGSLGKPQTLWECEEVRRRIGGRPSRDGLPERTARTEVAPG